MSGLFADKDNLIDRIDGLPAAIALGCGTCEHHASDDDQGDEKNAGGVLEEFPHGLNQGSLLSLSCSSAMRRSGTVPPMPLVYWTGLRAVSRWRMRS